MTNDEWKIITEAWNHRDRLLIEEIKFKKIEGIIIGAFIGFVITQILIMLNVGVIWTK